MPLLTTRLTTAAAIGAIASAAIGMCCYLLTASIADMEAAAGACAGLAALFVSKWRLAELRRSLSARALRPAGTVPDTFGLERAR